MFRIVISISFLLFSLVLHSQSKSALDLFRGDRIVANQYYDQMDYRNAIHFYEKVLEKKPDDLDSEFKIAKSYVSLNEPENSENWLRSLVSDPEATTEMKILYAEVLRRNGKVEEAKEWYGKILLEENNLEIKSKLDFLNNIDYYRRDSVYDVSNLPFNSDQFDFSLLSYNGKKLFLSSRQTERYIHHQPSNAISDNEGMLRYFLIDSSGANHFVYDEEVKPYYHDGPMSVYDDGKRVAFTRNNLRDATKSKGLNKVNLKIFFANSTDPAIWTDITPFKHNSNDYSVGHPAISSDGSVMFFSSDMPGGMGGADLYICFWEGNSWTDPVNLGDEINTSGNELFATLYNDTTLFFASSGLGGFGGLDLFTARFVNEQVLSPKNMGTPINSQADDFALTMDSTGRNGYFSSNREGGMGQDDIYSFKTIMYSGVGKVLTKQDSQPLQGAELFVEGVTSNFELYATTDEFGIFKMNLPYDGDYRITVKKEGHSDLYKFPYSTSNSRINYDTLELSLWRHELFAKGRLYSNETQELIEDVTVVLENLDTGVKDSLITDKNGTYSFPLAPDTRYKVTAKHDGFLINGFSINTNELYAGDLLNDILLEEEYVDKLVTYFDFNASELLQKYHSDMKQLIRTLRRYPNAIINIAAHADARGTETYNKRLSEERLKSVVDYLTRNGISKKRIKGIAFGEELLLNQCSNGVECEEEDHSKNRRAELKVQLNAIH